MCPSILSLSVIVIVVAAASAVLLPAVILWVICKKRAGEFFLYFLTTNKHFKACDFKIHVSCKCFDRIPLISEDEN